MMNQNQQDFHFIEETSSEVEIETDEKANTEAFKHFKSQFVSAEINNEESNYIQRILVDMSIPNSSTEEGVGSDYTALLNITSELRVIDKQGILLHGERIHRAREILKKYRDGAFTKWIQLVYGNRQTPYRMLQYYEFFRTLNQNDQRLMMSMSRRAAYVLASRGGERDAKLEIIREHYSSPSEDVIRLVQETFPLNPRDRRKHKENDAVIVEKIQKNLESLLKRKAYLTDSTKIRIRKLVHLLHEIADESI